MKIKTAVAILLLATFALSSIATMTIKTAKAAGSKTLMLSDAELMSAFDREWGGSLTLKTLIPPGVQFDFTGLSSTSGTGVGDNWEIDPLAGGALNGGHYCDFNGYTRYSVLFKNVGTNPVDVMLFMNTGFGGNPNHAWGSETFAIGASQSAVVTIDFSSVHDIDWSGSGGGPVINLDQVTNIGFQVYGGGSGSIVVSGLTAPLLYTTPTHIQKAPGDINSFFDVFVTLENFANLAGFDIKLTWDNNLITKDSVDYTTCLDTLWGAGQWWPIFESSGAGYYELAAAALSTQATNAGASDLFKVHFKVMKTCNIPLQTPIQFSVVKLSDNTEPIPNPIYATATDGMYYMSSTKPDLEFELVDPSPSKPFEVCKIFEVKVYATHCTNLEDYDLTILYDAGHLKGLCVDYWGVLGDNLTGQAGYAITTGSINVWDSGVVSETGDSLWLFTLRFHVELIDADITHIWRKNSPQSITADIDFGNAELSFLEGTIDIGGGITMPLTPLVITINLIRGDVDCNGVVNIDDISLVAALYAHPAADKPEYDLNNDLFIDIYDIVTIATNFGYPM